MTRLMPTTVLDLIVYHQKMLDPRSPHLIPSLIFSFLSVDCNNKQIEPSRSTLPASLQPLALPASLVYLLFDYWSFVSPAFSIAPTVSLQHPGQHHLGSIPRPPLPLVP